MSGAEWNIVLLSLGVASSAMAVGLPIAFGFAWLLARHEFPGKTLLDILIHLPLVLPPVVVGWVLLLLFGRNGVFGAWLYDWFGLAFSFDWKGASLAALVVAMPLMVRAMRLSIEGVDRRMENAARTLGAGRWRRFATIILPLCWPGIVAGLLLGFARALGEFGATIAFVANIEGETQTLSLAIYSAMQRPGGEDIVVRLGVISVVIAFLALLGSELLVRRRRVEARENV